MSVLRQLRAAAVARVKAGMPAFRDVRPHVGRYTIDDLKRLHGAAPACAIGIVNASKPLRRASGEIQIDATLAAVIVTRAARIEDADDEALDLALDAAACLAAWVPAATVPKVMPATDIHMEAVGDDEIDRSGLVVWAVIWKHAVTFGADQVAASLDDAHPLPPTLTVEVVP